MVGRPCLIEDTAPLSPSMPAGGGWSSFWGCWLDGIYIQTGGGKINLLKCWS